MSAAMQSIALNLDAPIGGWDAFSSLDNMPPDCAVVLDNLIPGPGSVTTRQGYALFFDTGTGAPVDTVASLNSNGSERFVMASAGGIWDLQGSDVSTGREVAPAGTYLNSRWQVEQFRKFDETNALIMCNGEDTTQIYQRDGNDFILRDIVDTSGAEEDGQGEGTFIGACTFKGRVFYWKAADDAFYYSQAGSYQGELKRFELGTVIQRGGKLVIVTNWTQQDSGDGKDDFLVFVFSTGEILIYQGDDPDPGGFWELVGKYYTSEPLSIRGSDHYGSDVIIMTRDGYINLSTIIQDGRTADVNQFSRLIYRAIVARTATKADAFGWECHLYPKDGLFVFNVPLTSVAYEQHVLNTVTMKWCRFTGMNMTCMTVHDDNLYGGTPFGQVMRLLTGTNDQGNPIQFVALTAYNVFDNPGYQKHVTAAQILSTHEDPNEIQLRAYSDYEFPVIRPIPVTNFVANEGIWANEIENAPPPSKGSFWADTVDSEKGSYWSSSLRPVTTKGWQNVSAYGYAVALLVQFARINESVIWRNTGIRYLMGGAQ